jgi:hypothetical protein
MVDRAISRPIRTSARVKARFSLDGSCLKAFIALEYKQVPSWLNAAEPVNYLRIFKELGASISQPVFNFIADERDGASRSHSPSFDQRRRPETLRTAIAMAFFCPTSTTSRLPRVMPV